METPENFKNHTMKQTILWLAALLLASCAQTLQVDVTNITQTERDDETVEIAWAELSSLKGLTPENVVVLDDEGEQITSQVIYHGQSEPQLLIFQVDLDAMQTQRLRITTGLRDIYAMEAYGRQVPERYDDYAWENNVIAYRLYGQALETSPEQLTSPAIDIWVKSTDRLVIDDWYTKPNYHQNDGDGMDCYKAGRTLGGGAALPFTDGRFWLMGHNYATQQTLDNGPLRTTVKLTYAPFEVDSVQVSLTKYISLDANQHLNRMVSIYEGNFTQMPIAAGFSRHDVKALRATHEWLALCEATSDTPDPARDGDIYAGIVLPGAQFLPDSLGHALAVVSVKPGVPMTYLAGAGWSQGGVENMDEWIETINAEAAAFVSPLQVAIRK